MPKTGQYGSYQRGWEYFNDVKAVFDKPYAADGEFIKYSHRAEKNAYGFGAAMAQFGQSYTKRWNQTHHGRFGITHNKGDFKMPTKWGSI